MTAPDRPLVGEERIAALAETYFPIDVLPAKNGYVRELLRHAIREAGEEMLRLIDARVAALSADGANEEAFELSNLADAIRQRLT